MSDEYSQDFDLLTLLKLGDLNIRSVADTKSAMKVVDYFNLLSKFTNLAPAASGALTKIIGLDGDEKAIKCLADISILLSGIGCDKFIAEIDIIFDAYKKDDKKSAADCAKKISDDFVDLYTRTITARKKQNLENLAKILNDDNLSYDDNSDLDESLTLKEILKQLDEENAARKLRILAVDDSSVILRTITSVLSAFYKIYTLAKPTMLEKILQQITPDLFLLDYKMPELSGFDLIPIIRSFKEHEDTPIIFLTSEGTVENLSAAIMLGACDFVVKPVRPEILREKIASHIVRKKLF